MTTWLDIVKKHAKLNPGKSLKEYLPLAKAEWDDLKKSGNVLVSNVLKNSKKVKGSKSKKVKSSKSKKVKSSKSKKVKNSKSKKKMNNDIEQMSISQGSQAAAVLTTAMLTAPLARSKARVGGKLKKSHKSRKNIKSRKSRKNRTTNVIPKTVDTKDSTLDITSINLK